MTKALSVVRSILFFLYMALTVIPWGLTVCICAPFLSADSIYRWCINWVALAHYGSGWICGVKKRVIGMENIPTAQDSKAAVILASKHQSTWETFAYPVVMPHPLAYVFKRELIYVPFFGWAMARMDMIHIDRSKRSEAWNKVAQQGKRLSALGKWVIMFPEGTRSARGAKGDDARGRGVDRGRDAAPRSRGLRATAGLTRPQWPARTWATSQSTTAAACSPPRACSGEVRKRPCTASAGTPMLPMP